MWGPMIGFITVLFLLFVACVVCIYLGWVLYGIRKGTRRRVECMGYPLLVIPIENARGY